MVVAAKGKRRSLICIQSQLEEEIYRFEGSYLEETTAGNIIKGFDNYIKGASNTGGSTGTGGGTSTRRRGGITDADRIFSRSSASFTRVRTAALGARRASRLTFDVGVFAAI